MKGQNDKKNFLMGDNSNYFIYKKVVENVIPNRTEIINETYIEMDEMLTFDPQTSSS